MKIIDAALYKTFKTLPAFPFANLVRQHRASARLSREQFLANRTVPHFVYHRLHQFDDVKYIESLRLVQDQIASISVAEDIRKLYIEKLNELHTRARLIGAMKQKDDFAVSVLADELFGTCAQTGVELADEFDALLARSHELHTHRPRIDATRFEKMVRATLDRYGLQHWTTRLVNRSSISVARSESQERPPVVKIPKNLLVTRSRAARLLTHEIEVHALRTANGMTSPMLLLGRGLAGYVATDEGLALAMQRKIGTGASAMPGLWDAWAAALSKETDFRSCFETLYDARRKLNVALNINDADDAALDSAWRLMMRVTRGIHHPNAVGLGFRRDHLYRSGFIDVQHAIARHGESTILPTLFAGHASLAHIPFLQSRGIVGRVPDFVGKRIVKEGMRGSAPS